MIQLLLCYDIACQYGKNFWTRLTTLPSQLQFIKPPNLTFKVPKFHLPAHKVNCHGPFSLNYTMGVGRTDGEGVERNWSWLNDAAPSTSQMGPGARHDTLDDYMGFWNHKKTTEFGSFRFHYPVSSLADLSHPNYSGDKLLKGLVDAIPSAIIHRQAFRIFTENLSKEHLPELQEWETMVNDWEAGRSQTDPYLVTEDSMLL